MEGQTFVNKLEAQWAAGKHLCVGLDPARLPATDPSWRSGIGVLEFCKDIVYATAPFAAAMKPNLAFFLARGHTGVRDLEDLCRFIRREFPEIVIILDGKFGDIGNTNEKYASFAFDVCGADAVTVNPYVGGEGLKPFFARPERGAFVLCRTSNPGAGELQDLLVEDGAEEVYAVVAEDVESSWNDRGNCGLVVGATAPEELERIRSIASDLPLLIPGVGAQGGDLAAAVKAARHRFVVNASRSILEASSGADFAEAAAREAERLHAAINAAREE